MTQPPDPYPATRELPRIPPRQARPAGHLPTNEAPFIRPVPPAARPASVPAPEPEPTDALSELFTDYPDPRSQNPLHRYGPQILVAGAVALLAVLVLVLIVKVM